jgi:hypothetical protein
MVIDFFSYLDMVMIIVIVIPSFKKMDIHFQSKLSKLEVHENKILLF